ncbi:unnamed protein product [Lupinus luteus]|uniref:SHSP domain-containing protein n=1 Tax=Lupinus luteus TaxID=3873 RepID=A0AAV1XHG7_LUPLU
MILSSIIIAVLLLIIIESNNLVVGAEMMKIHPLPLRRNITIQFGNTMNPNLGKKLRRLPHVFTRVLELPFRSDADVTIHEDPDCFRFVAETDRIADVRAHTVEIHPGVIKIAVRVGPSVEFSLDQLEIDMWRFRLPESTQPELATATFVDGELIVTVPKRSGNATISALPSARLHLESVIRTGVSTVLDQNAPLCRHCVRDYHPQ